MKPEKLFAFQLSMSKKDETLHQRNKISYCEKCMSLNY